jgi:hypothetical protein
MEAASLQGVGRRRRAIPTTEKGGASHLGAAAPFVSIGRGAAPSGPLTSGDAHLVSNRSLLPTQRNSFNLKAMNLGKIPSACGIAESGEALVARAEALIREFPGCFWFRHPYARVRDRGDIALVIRHLREYGDRRAWKEAQELQKCL